MPIYRCNQCGFVCEDSQTPVHTQTPCGRCASPSTVYGTVFFVEELVKRLASVTRDYKALQAQQVVAPAAAAATAPATAATPTSVPRKLDAAPQIDDGEPHTVLAQWFSQKNIEVRIDPSAADTSGFFDEAAMQLGNTYELFADLLDRVRYAYRKSYTNVNLELGKLSQKDGQAITKFCRTLYEHTFFSRYHFQRPEKIARLSLQTAPAVRQFFEGGWLEWYALMQVLTLKDDKRNAVSYARNVKVVFPNEDLHELDVVCLPTGQMPICIECKSGEFRRDIDKYLRLSKRLGVGKERFIVCSTDLTEAQAQGLTAMYDLSFVNLQTLKKHLQKII